MVNPVVVQSGACNQCAGSVPDTSRIPSEDLRRIAAGRSVIAPGDPVECLDLLLDDSAEPVEAAGQLAACPDLERQTPPARTGCTCLIGSQLRPGHIIVNPVIVASGGSPAHTHVPLLACNRRSDGQRAVMDPLAVVGQDDFRSSPVIITSMQPVTDIQRD